MVTKDGFLLIGGGTVVYVTNRNHLYSQDIESREEGGTPEIIGSIRAGMAFQLKHFIGYSAIRRREEYLVKHGIATLRSNPNIILLGSKVSPRLPILSFLVKHEETKKLVHHNFIAVLLSDLFGIQSRGGCACAGPYAQSLLGLADDVADSIQWFLDAEYRRNSVINSGPGSNEPGKETVHINTIGLMKPGFVRINLAYFMTDEEVNYILTAVNLIANEGWKLLPQYTYNKETGDWAHRREAPHHKLMSLHDINYELETKLGMSCHGYVNPKSEPGQQMQYKAILSEARRIIRHASQMGRQIFPADEITVKDILPSTLATYIWFLEPHYAMMLMNRSSSLSLAKLRTESIPLQPRVSSGPGMSLKPLSSHIPRIMLKDEMAKAQASASRLHRGSMNCIPQHRTSAPDYNTPSYKSNRVLDWVNASQMYTIPGM